MGQALEKDVVNGNHSVFPGHLLVCALHGLHDHYDWMDHLRHRQIHPDDSDHVGQSFQIGYVLLDNPNGDWTLTLKKWSDGILGAKSDSEKVKSETLNSMLPSQILPVTKAKPTN
jgi:hypothetical protein